MKKHFFVLLSSALLITFSACTTALNVVPRSSNQSVLYVWRADAPLSKKHKVKVFLNQKEVTELSADEYKALHIKPGKYDIEFIVHKPNGSKQSPINFTAQIEPNTVKVSSIAYIFGWKAPNKFIEGKNESVLKRFIFAGELDLTSSVKPK